MLWSLTRKQIYTRAGKNVKLLRKESIMLSTKALLKRKQAESYIKKHKRKRVSVTPEEGEESN